MDEKEWKKVESSKFEIWTPTNKGESIEGELVGKEENVGEFNAKAYTIKNKEGKVLSAYGCAVLDEKMSLIEVGQEVKIVYGGFNEEKNYKIYEVYTR